MKLQIHFVSAPPHMVQLADEILRTDLRCTPATRRDIRALAKAYIDEADEMNRTVQEIQTNAPNAQIQSLSPAEMIERARRLMTISLSSGGQQAKVSKLAESYVRIAEENQRLFDEFVMKYRDHLPPPA